MLVSLKYLDSPNQLDSQTTKKIPISPREVMTDANYHTNMTYPHSKWISWPVDPLRVNVSRALGKLSKNKLVIRLSTKG